MPRRASAGNKNAASRVADTTPPPWWSWKGSRAGRFVRFAETYIRLPKGHGHGQPLVLLGWEKDFAEEFLAEHVTAAGLTVARGAGKSSLFTALATFAGFESAEESGSPFVPIIAVSLAQARSAVYSGVVSAVLHEPELANRSITFQGMGTERIWVPLSEGIIAPKAGDPDTLQGMDLTLGLVDEFGHLGIETWNAVLMSRKRPGARVLGAGTFGPDRDSALYQLRNVVRGGGAPESFVWKEFSGAPGADINDEDNWPLANPSLPFFPDIEFLRNAAAMSPEPLFRTYHLNEPDVVGHDSWLGSDARVIWDSLEDPYTLVPKAPTWVGLDVGLIRDSTAVVAVQNRTDKPKMHATARIWMPSPGSTVDIADVVQHLRDLADTYDVQEISFDPRLFELPSLMLIDEGLRMTRVDQSIERMTPIVGGLYELIRRAGITHDHDTAFGDQVVNAVPRLNERGFTLSKSKSAPRGHIDSCVALALAVDRASHPKKQRAPLVVL